MFMLTPMLAQILIQAALLCLILFLVAKHEADYSFGKVAMVTAGIGLGSIIIEVSTRRILGTWTDVAIVGFSAFMIMTFCWISFGKSLLVVVLFVGAHYGLKIGVALLWAMMFGAEPVAPETDTETGTNVTEEVSVKHKAIDLLKGVVNSIAGDEEKPEPEPIAEVPPTPEPPAPVEIPDDWEGARAKLQASNYIYGGGRYIATVNGRVVGAGAILAVTHEGKVYRWRVKNIQKNRLDLEEHDVRPEK